MADTTVSLFPQFMSQVGGGSGGIVYGSGISTTVTPQLDVTVQGELTVDNEGAPLLVQPTITVSLQGDLDVDIEGSN